jgi:hypothetical protein
MYIRQQIGQDFSFDPTLNVDIPYTSDILPALPDFVYQPVNPSDVLSQIIPTYGVATVPATSGIQAVNPTQSGGDWVSNIASALATGVKAFFGPSTGAVPAGYYRDPTTGQLKPLAAGTYQSSLLSNLPTWVLPAGIGLAAAYFLTKKK